MTTATDHEAPDRVEADGRAPRSLLFWGGLGGLAFTVLTVVQNAVLLADSPLPGDDLESVLAFYVDAEGKVAAASGLVGLNVVFVVAFVAACAHLLAERRRTRPAGIAAVAGIVLVVGAFVTTTALQAVLAARAESLAAAGQLGLVWDLHNAAFTMSSGGLALTLLALATGSLLGGGLVPRWIALVALFGAACLLVAAALVVPSVDGGAGPVLQLVGFATWLLVLVAGGLRLVRR